MDLTGEAEFETGLHSSLSSSFIFFHPRSLCTPSCTPSSHFSLIFVSLCPVSLLFCPFRLQLHLLCPCQEKKIVLSGLRFHIYVRTILLQRHRVTDKEIEWLHFHCKLFGYYFNKFCDSSKKICLETKLICFGGQALLAGCVFNWISNLFPPFFGFYK